MQFDSQERPLIFYIILFGILIGAIVFFSHNVKKAINAGRAKEEAQLQTVQEEVTSNK